MRTFHLLIALLSTSILLAQTTLAEDLGYPRDARLLIVHADDLGMAHSVNAASFEAMTNGYVNSASIMMPTPWVTEVAAFAKTHPDADLGLHLTLTSEWTNYRWGPMGRDSVGTLLDENHYLHGSCPAFAENATAQQVKLELRRQVQQALRLGINPTHLDTHMGCLVFTTPQIFQAYVEIGREFNLPVLVDRESTWGANPAFEEILQPSDMLVDRVIGIGVEDQGNFQAGYDKIITTLKPGVNVLLLHCAYDGPEFQAAAAPQVPYGAAWRQEDFDYFKSAHFKALLEEQHVITVTWKELWEKWKTR